MDRDKLLLSYAEIAYINSKLYGTGDASASVVDADVAIAEAAAAKALYAVVDWLEQKTPGPMSDTGYWAAIGDVKRALRTLLKQAGIERPESDGDSDTPPAG